MFLQQQKVKRKQGKKESKKRRRKEEGKGEVNLKKEGSMEKKGQERENTPNLI